MVIYFLFAVDHTRVLLMDGSLDVLGSDYINASFIEVSAIDLTRRTSAFCLRQALMQKQNHRLMQSALLIAI